MAFRNKIKSKKAKKLSFVFPSASAKACCWRRGHADIEPNGTAVAAQWHGSGNTTIAMAFNGIANGMA